jgi:hypothetical protein
VRARRWLLPSLADCFFLSLLAWLFVAGSGWSGLLADGDTGWHIRTGEFILDHQQLPARDLFSFSKAGEQWLAWEWLSDVLLAGLYRALGLKGVVLAAALAACASVTLVLRHALWRGANSFVALAACLMGAGASSIHYLARPHVFTLGLLAASLWILERDRRRPTPAVWLLIPISVLWVNVHGGFLALLVCLVVLAIGTALETLLGAAPRSCEETGQTVRKTGKNAYSTTQLRELPMSGIGIPACTPVPSQLPQPRLWHRPRRYAILTAACGLATLLNPYGVRLHAHIAAYLRSDWIREAVHEFQSPRFRSEAAAQFEILLFAGLLVAGRLLARKQFADALLLVVWAHAALVSVRHIPVFVLVVIPPATEEGTLLWKRWAARRPAGSLAAILDKLAEDASAGFRRTSLMLGVALVLLVLPRWPLKWPRDFPAEKFPTGVIERYASRLRGARVFTSDQWGDYLIYRFYPQQRVFIDGRSDFYGPELGKLYLRLTYAQASFEEAVGRWGFELVLAPVEWPLVSLLRRDARWGLLEEDRLAALFERRRDALPLKKNLHTAEISR